FCKIDVARFRFEGPGGNGPQKLAQIAFTGPKSSILPASVELIEIEYIALEFQHRERRRSEARCSFAPGKARSFFSRNGRSAPAGALNCSLFDGAVQHDQPRSRCRLRDESAFGEIGGWPQA